MLTQNEVMSALRQVMDPELNRSLVELNMVRELEISPSGEINFTLTLTIPSCPMRNQIMAEAREALMALPGVKSVKIKLGAMTPEERRAVLGRSEPVMPKLNQFNKIGSVIAVMSGKGGVGKSSVSALLAVSLARRGFKVGILDADITGPSIPRLFGLPAGGLRGGEQGFLPAVTRRGIKVVSANLLLKSEDTAVIWRGPMISGVIKQFWSDTLWGRLDYLLVDLPPGTSDAALAVTQNLPLNGVVLVTTPQELATLVVRKAVHMLEQVNVSVLAVVENMSFFVCPDTGKRHEIFGPSHLDETVQATGALYSTRVPINPEVTARCDSGQVEELVVAEMDELALQVVEQVKNMPSIPSIAPTPSYSNPD
jgi:Mrp family chromosome partitioning ATPase